MERTAMRQALLLWVSLVVTAASSPAFAHDGKGALARPAALEGMAYGRARKIILGYGWMPAPGPCLQVSKDTCTRFPEIEACSGVEEGYCALLFLKEDRCLDVLTAGGEPEGDEDGDIHVKAVGFSRGPCTKH